MPRFIFFQADTNPALGCNTASVSAKHRTLRDAGYTRRDSRCRPHTGNHPGDLTKDNQEEKAARLRDGAVPSFCYQFLM